MSPVVEATAMRTEYEHAHDSYGRHYIGLARRLGPFLRGGGQPDHGVIQIKAVAALAAERDNLLAAFDWALTNGHGHALFAIFTCLAEFLDISSDFPLLNSCARLVLSAARDDNHAALAFEAHLATARMRWRAGNYDSARRNIERAEALMPTFGSEKDAARCWQLTAALDYNQGHLTSARQLYERALQAYRKCQDAHGEAHMLNLLALLEDTEGNAQQAELLFSQSLDLARALGDARGEANALNNLGSLVRGRGDLDESFRLHAASLLLRQALGDRHGESACLNNLGVVQMRRGSLERAKQMYEQSLALKRELGDRQGQYKSLGNLGNLALRLGDNAQAEAYLRQALAICQSLGELAGEATVCGNLVSLVLDRGGLAEAADLAQRSLKMNRRLGAMSELPAGVLRAACVLSAHGNAREAALAFYGSAHWAELYPLAGSESQLRDSLSAKLETAITAGELSSGDQAELTSAGQALDLNELVYVTLGMLERLSLAQHGSVRES